MIAGFKSEIYCEGIIGDGCGGGRIFIVEDETLIAYEPQTKEKITLLKNIHMPRSITKKGCIITIECEDETIKFDLSSLSII
jgi:hypothetical protein